VKGDGGKGGPPASQTSTMVGINLQILSRKTWLSPSAVVKTSTDTIVCELTCGRNDLDYVFYTICGGTQKNRIFFKKEDLFTFRTKNI